ncbi:helix-turn-helix domain-containing protein [Pedobacter sp. HMF7056]|uniref:Helix-turn-helix domain-containing protein n=2 Tax=Hufsiella ginkgonis TaxID=2695274 RepID=A0A7K1XXL5_9SPHI|nr:helix-turn-helix domain-containing protein [Hufsiella ginkgonis]
MRYEIYAPCERLKPYVKHLVISEAGEAQTYPVLPGAAVVMGFQYRGKLELVEKGQPQALASSGITGLLDAYRLFKNSPQTGTVLVVFTETGASHFMAIPIHELFRQSIALDALFSRRQTSEVEEQLQYAGSDRERISIVERFLVGNLISLGRDKLVQQAIHHIYQSGGTVRISQVAKLLNSSQSPLEKRFRAKVGASPKKFAGIVRAGNMVNALERGRLHLAEYLSSYYDQAHFIKDFKKFTSYTPERYLKAVRRNSKTG